MNEQPESPFFPVPVRWFEIPIQTARWGFIRTSETANHRSGPVASEPAEHSVSADAASDETSAPSRIGRLLDVKA